MGKYATNGEKFIFLKGSLTHQAMRPAKIYPLNKKVYLKQYFHI